MRLTSFHTCLQTGLSLSAASIAMVCAGASGSAAIAEAGTTRCELALLRTIALDRHLDRLLEQRERALRALPIALEQAERVRELAVERAVVRAVIGTPDERRQHNQARVDQQIDTFRRQVEVNRVELPPQIESFRTTLAQGSTSRNVVTQLRRAEARLREGERFTALLQRLGINDRAVWLREHRRLDALEAEVVAQALDTVDEVAGPHHRFAGVLLDWAGRLRGDLDSTIERMSIRELLPDPDSATMTSLWAAVERDSISRSEVVLSDGRTGSVAVHRTVRGGNITISLADGSRVTIVMTTVLSQTNPDVELQGGYAFDPRRFAHVSDRVVLNEDRTLRFEIGRTPERVEGDDSAAGQGGVSPRGRGSEPSDPRRRQRARTTESPAPRGLSVAEGHELLHQVVDFDAISNPAARQERRAVAFDRQIRNEAALLWETSLEDRRSRDFTDARERALALVLGSDPRQEDPSHWMLVATLAVESEDVVRARRTLEACASLPDRSRARAAGRPSRRARRGRPSRGDSGGSPAS